MADIKRIRTLNKNRILFDDQETNYNPIQDEFYETILGFENLPTKIQDYKNAITDLRENGKIDKNTKDFQRKWSIIRNFNPVLDRIVIDVDSDNLQDSLETTRNIVNDLKEYFEYINIYFSGSKGFHIEINTEALTIVDTTADRAGDSCLQYKWFLNYFKDKYNEVDTSISDGTRLFRQHHSIHKKTGNYKVLVDIKQDLDTIIENSKADNDMVEKKPVMNSKTAMEILATYSKPQDNKSTYKPNRKKNYTKNVVDYSVKALMDKLYEIAKYNGGTTHDYVNLLGFCCTGQLDEEQIIEFAKDVASNTDSANAYESCIDAYYNNRNPEYSFGGLYNELELYYSYDSGGSPLFDGDWKAEKNLRYKLFNDFKAFLEGIRVNNNYIKFKQILEDNDYDLPKIIRENVFDYINNEDVLSLEILLCLMTGLGLDGFILVLNAPAGSGKTENKDALFELIPNGNEFGKITPAALYRLNEKDYNRYVIYTNDKGLEKGQQQQTSEEARGIFRELATDGHIQKTIAEPHKKGVIKYVIVVEATALIVTELHTLGDGWGMGRQMERVTVRLDVNPITKAEYRGIAKIMQHSENKAKVKTFKQMHSDYMQHLINNADTEAIIPDNVLEAIDKECDPIDVTAYKRLISLYRTYCIYFNLDVVDIQNVDSFRRFISPIRTIGQYEEMLLEHLKKYVTPFDDTTNPVPKESNISNLTTTFDVDGESEVRSYHRFRLTRKKTEQSDGTYTNNNGETIYFFTVQDVRNCHIYNKGRPLHEYKDDVSDFLQRLRNAGLIEYVDTSGDKRLYYIPK